jgi:hypothetical protein
MSPTPVSVPAHYRILYILHRKKESNRKWTKQDSTPGMLYVDTLWYDRKGRRESRGERKQLCIVRHDSKKLLLIDLAVLIEVKLVYHRLSDGGVSQRTQEKRRKKRTIRRPRVGPQSLWQRAGGCVWISCLCCHHRTAGTRAESPP